jgi:hypothetical protein
VSVGAGRFERVGDGCLKLRSRHQLACLLKDGLRIRVPSCRAQCRMVRADFGHDVLLDVRSHLSCVLRPLSGQTGNPVEHPHLVTKLTERVRVQTTHVDPPSFRPE